MAIVRRSIVSLGKVEGLVALSTRLRPKIWRVSEGSLRREEGMRGGEGGTLRAGKKSRAGVGTQCVSGRGWRLSRRRTAGVERVRASMGGKQT